MRAVVNEASKKEQKDAFVTKVAKFIPGEVTAVYAAIATAGAAAAKETSEADPPSGFVIAAFVIGLIAAPGYWYLTSKTGSGDGRITRWYAYTLSAVAFVPWALAVSKDTRTVFGVGDAVAEYLLIVGALVVPLINGLLERWVPDKDVP